MSETTEHAGIAAALVAVQAEIKNPPKARDATVKGISKKGVKYEYDYKYADIADVLKGALPVLSKHGIAVTQATSVVEGTMQLITTLHHTSGETLSSQYPVCAIGGGDHQEMGKALTYARRYAFCPMIGIAAEEDIDAKPEGTASAGAPVRGKPISVQQAKQEVNWPEIEATIREADTERLLLNIKNRIDDHEKRGSWPASYVSSARELIDVRQAELEKLAEASETEDAPG